MSNYPKRGEIYWANLDSYIGSEIAKTRPVLIVSNDINKSICSHSQRITHNFSYTNRVYPYEVVVNPTESGLKNNSKIKANQIRTIDKLRIGKD